MPENPPIGDARFVHERMVEIETEGSGNNRGLAQAAADIIGVACDDDFMKLLYVETQRTQFLCREHYAPKVAVLPNEQAMAAALVQGATMAVAIREAIADRRPILAVVMEALNARGWTIDGDGYTAPDGRRTDDLSDALAMQSLREIGAS